MQTIVTDEYSLWLEPDPVEAEGFQKRIIDFAQRAGTPIFKPHLTLLPGLQGEERILVEKLSQFAHNGEYSVELKKAHEGDAYHKCLYIEGRLSEQLAEMRKKSEAIFELKPPFYPHISLAYGLEGPLRELFKKELEEKHFTFTAKTLSLWHAKGEPHEWKKVAFVPLV